MYFFIDLLKRAKTATHDAFNTASDKMHNSSAAIKDIFKRPFVSSCISSYVSIDPFVFLGLFIL